MTQPSPADTLRAAAERLRTLSTAASEGPWTMNQWGNIETAHCDEVAEVWPLNCGPDTNARFIAAMHPGVGTALAQWLDYHAGMSDRLAQLFDEPPLTPDDHPALAVARAILGEEQP